MKNNYIGDIKADDLFIAADENEKEEEAIKSFSIPVEWIVTSKIEVKARSLKEAVDWAKENVDLIKLNPEPEYLEGSYKLYDEENYINEDEYLAYLEEVYNAIGYPEDYTPEEAYEDYCYDWCKERGYDYYTFDEELGQNGECYSCYDEFMENDFLDYINGGLL